MYMGANQDAIEVSASLGVARDRLLTYAVPKVAGAMGAYSASVGTIREAVAAGALVEQARRRAAYSNEQRRKAAD
jgi:hypothetical protein